MSSILKALRRLEEEKSARREGRVDLARDILLHPGRRRASRSWLLPAGALVVLALAAAAVAFALLRTPQPLPVAEPATASTPVFLPVPAPPPEPTGAVTAPRPVSPAPKPTGILRQIPADDRIIEERIGDFAPAIVVNSGDPPSKRLAARPSAPRVPPLPPRPAENRPAAAKEEPTSFRLSGIVYQDDPEARVAVVNDLPVMKGTVVDGATITEILPDRVRLHFADGRAADLFLEP